MRIKPAPRDLLESWQGGDGMSPTAARDWRPEGKTENWFRSMLKCVWIIRGKGLETNGRSGDTQTKGTTKMRVRSAMWEQVKEELIWTDTQERGIQCHGRTLSPSWGLPVWVPLKQPCYYMR